MGINFHCSQVTLRHEGLPLFLRTSSRLIEWKRTNCKMITRNKISAKAGIQENTGFPRIKYGAGLVKPGMTNRLKFMSSCIYSVDLIIMLEAGKSC